MATCNSCNGCGDLGLEAWPRGATAARCMSRLPPVGTIQHYGRTMQVFNMGEVGTIQTPAWCPKNKKEEAT